MTIEEYQLLTTRSNRNWPTAAASAAHSALGITGEFQEFWNADDNDQEVIKEAGDIMWYISELANVLDIKLELIAYDENQHDEMSEDASIGYIAESCKKWFAYDKYPNKEVIRQHLEFLILCVSENAEEYCSLETSDLINLIMQTNIDKLRARFPEKFSAELAMAKLDEVG